MHKTVLLNEAIDNLNIKEDGIYVDCTLGFGGHSGLILERIKRGFLFAFDQDDMALEYSEKKLKEIGSNFELIKSNFAYIKEELNKRKPVFIEMGLQTSHDSTASFLNRAYPTETFTKTCHALAEAGIRVTAHIILGLPGETLDMELDTIRYLNTLPVSGIKISMLYVLKNTVLASYYEQHPFHILTMEEYINHLIICLSQLRKDIVIERMTGDGPKDLLIVPKWIGHKRPVLNTIHKEMKQRNFTQGGSLCQKNL